MSSHLAAIAYKSGRRVYVRDNPRLGQFTARREIASEFNTKDEAEDAARELAHAFKIRNYDAIKLIAEPA